MNYQLKRKKNMKRIILKVDEKGQIQISAPFHVTERQIEAFLAQQEEWIQKAKEKSKTSPRRISPFQEDYKNGQVLQLFGKKLRLQILEAPFFSVNLDGDRLLVSYQEGKRAALGDNLRQWLLKLLEKEIRKELQHAAKALSLYPKYFLVKSMKSAWGIYHPQKNYISFNAMLLAQPKDFIRYVVVHELCHIKHPNHQAAFWKLVETQVPDYKTVRKEFR